MQTKKNNFKVGRIILILSIIIFGLLLFVGIRAYPRVVDAKFRFGQLNKIAVELESMIENHDYNVDHGVILINEANEHIKNIKSDVQPYYPFFNTISTFPWVGQYASQVQPTIEWVSSIFDSTKIIIDAISPTLGESVYSNGQLQVLQQFIAAQPKIKNAQLVMNQAEQSSTQIQFDLFPEKYQSKLVKLVKVQSLLTEGIKLLLSIPDIAGANTPGTYLIMLQNSDELRPTGGFITAFGLINITQGNLTLLDFKDTETDGFTSEVIQAPTPLKQILLAHYWLPRDGNWSPSFPESALQVQNLHFLATGIKTDGVIGINQSTVKELLKFTGPITIDDEIIDSSNVIDYMIAYKINAEVAGQGVNRKDFIKPLASEIIKSISEKTGKDQLIEFSKLIWRMLNNGELLVYSNNQNIQSILADYNIDGDLHPNDGDFLMVVDANLGFDKIDYVIQRSLLYSIDLRNKDKIISNLNITYINPMVGEMTCLQWGEAKLSTKKEYLYPTCYADFYRIYRPKSTIINSFRSPDFSDSFFNYSEPWSHNLEENPSLDDLVELSGFFVLPTNTTDNTIIEQTLPSTVIQKTGGFYQYKLIIQKQPGVSQLPVTLKITLPEGTSIVPEESNISLINENGIYTWQSTLESNITTVIIAYQ